VRAAAVDGFGHAGNALIDRLDRLRRAIEVLRADPPELIAQFVERWRPQVFNTKTPHSLPTFLVDGRVAGTWKHERGRVMPAPFEPLRTAVEREVAAEAERLAAFMA